MKSILFSSVVCLLIPIGGILYMPVFTTIFQHLIGTHLMRTMTTQATTSGLYSMAFVTVPNMEVGKKLAGGIVEKKLAACVNIIPQIVSVYKWEGKIENDNELLLMIKTRTATVPDLSKFVRENHPYDVAEVISSTIDDGNPPYLKWIGEIVPEPKPDK